jgi:hypothetical protein
MHCYYHESFEARERMSRRMREAEAERMMRQLRARRRRRWHMQLSWAFWRQERDAARARASA